MLSVPQKKATLAFCKTARPCPLCFPVQAGVGIRQMLSLWPHCDPVLFMWRPQGEGPRAARLWRAQKKAAFSSLGRAACTNKVPTDGASPNGASWPAIIISSALIGLLGNNVLPSTCQRHEIGSAFCFSPGKGGGGQQRQLYPCSLCLLTPGLTGWSSQVSAACFGDEMCFGNPFCSPSPNISVGSSWDWLGGWERGAKPGDSQWTQGRNVLGLRGEGSSLRSSFILLCQYAPVWSWLMTPVVRYHCKAKSFLCHTSFSTALHGIHVVNGSDLSRKFPISQQKALTCI